MTKREAERLGKIMLRLKPEDVPKLLALLATAREWNRWMLPPDEKRDELARAIRDCEGIEA